jgi:RNA polymerase sigma-70 factor (ECF subfamily)
MGVPEAELEDAVQEVFMVVHRRLSDFTPGTSERSWLYAMCIRIGRAHRRKAAKHRERVSALPPPPQATAPSKAQSEQLHKRQVALRLLDALDEDKRAVFLLYHVEQMSMPEVARALGCPLQTAYSRLKAAQKKLTQIVSKAHEGGAL